MEVAINDIRVFLNFKARRMKFEFDLFDVFGVFLFSEEK
jgi:hypothetical protein